MLAVEDPQHAVGLARRTGQSSAIAAERSAPRPCSAAAGPCIQTLNASRVRASKVRKISSSWTAWETWASGSVPPSGSVGALAVAGGQLDVGLAEQRLLAQDRPGVVGDRRVLAVELDRRVGEPVVREVDRLHLADRDPGDPHVGLTASCVASLNGTVNR